MAGVASDLWGRTSLEGLWACGEVTSTGVHGGNRLASNSLLEGLVFGARVAEDVASRGPHRIYGGGTVWREAPGTGAGQGMAVDAQDVRRLMWENVGLERDRAGLQAALEGLAALGERLGETPDVTGNLVTLGRMVTAAALLREESRGAHFRTDFPATAPTARRQHVLYRPDDALPVVPLGEPAPREIGRREIA